MERSRALQVGFICFGFAQLISLFGDRLHQFSVVGMIGVTAPGSSEELLVLALFTHLPVLLLAPVLGAIVDRWDKITVMIVVDAFRGVLVLMVPTLYGIFGSLYAFYVPVAFLAAANMLFAPAKSAALPELFGAQRLLKMNAILWAVGIIGTLGGFVAGGVLFDYLSWRVSFYTDGISYLVSIVFFVPLLALRPPKVPTADRDVGARPRPRWYEGLSVSIRTVALGLELVARNRALVYGLLLQTALFGAFGIVYVIGVAHVQAVFPDGRTMPLAWIASAGTVGLLIGSAMSTVLCRGARGTRVVGLAVIAFGFAFVGLGRAEGLTLMAVSAFVIGLGASPLFVVTETILQTHSPADFRGRVFATREVLTRTSFLAASAAATGFDALAEREIILIVIGLFFAVSGVKLSISRSLQFSTISRNG